MLNKFHPANAANATDEDIQEMRGLTIEQVEELAITYPNTASGNNYLILYDNTKKPNEQQYPISSWPNLLSLWKLRELKYIPFDYYSRFFNRKTPGLRSLTPQVADVSVEEISNELKSNKITEQKTKK